MEFDKSKFTYEREVNSKVRRYSNEFLVWTIRPFCVQLIFLNHPSKP